MTDDCWCVAYHHPEYEKHPENETWFCECCARGHKLPNTKYIDEALAENARAMAGPFVPPHQPDIAEEDLAPVMYASGMLDTRRTISVIAEHPEITAQGLIIVNMNTPSQSLDIYLQTRSGIRITI